MVDFYIAWISEYHEKEGKLSYGIMFLIQDLSHTNLQLRHWSEFLYF